MHILMAFVHLKFLFAQILIDYFSKRRYFLSFYKQDFKIFEYLTQILQHLEEENKWKLQSESLLEYQ